MSKEKRTDNVDFDSLSEEGKEVLSEPTEDRIATEADEAPLHYLEADDRIDRARWEEEEKKAAEVARQRKEEGLKEKEVALAEYKKLKKENNDLKKLYHSCSESESESVKAKLDASTKALNAAADKVKEADEKIKLSHIKFKKKLADSNTILSLSHVRMYFNLGSWPDYVKLKAVHDVSFDIKEGETFGIVGESGCGKSTTGRSIIHLYDITSGSIYYKGYRIGAGDRWNKKEIKYSRIHAKEHIKELEAQCEAEIAANPSAAESIKAKYAEKIEATKRRNAAVVEHQKKKIKGIHYDNKHIPASLMNEIQMIFQDPVDSLDPRMTVEDIIQEGLQIQGHHNRLENHEKTVDILSKVGLVPEHASRYPHEFSGGQRQRIGIARALIMNPKLLICDEPISALDVSIRAQIINLLNDLKEEMGLTMIFIAHDLSTVKYFCNRIAVMYFGNLVELTTSDELFKHPLHPYTKSLLSAIPQPNPLSEKKRVRITYNPMESHDYSKQKPTFQEVCPGHFILCNDAELEAYRKEIADLDSGKIKLKNGIAQEA